MKTILLLAAALVSLSAGQATAGAYGPSAAPKAKLKAAKACAPVLKHTCVIARRCEWRTACTPCGQTYRYQVMITTLRAYYSDGSTRTWTKAAAV